MRKFSPRLAEHFEAAPDRKTRHDAGDKQVRPCLLGAEYAQRRTENCNVTDGIVARTDPHRAHVRIAFAIAERSEEHTSELQSLMRISYAVFCLKKKNKQSKSSMLLTLNDT